MRKTKPWHGAFWVSLLLALLAASCAQTETEPYSPMDHSDTETKDDLLANKLLTGELIAVDLVNQTLVVRTDDALEHRFAFSDELTVTGTAGTQGLAGQEGNRVRVFYRDPGSENTSPDPLKTAYIIELW